MDDDAALDQARLAMLEGDTGSARRIVEAVLARSPAHAGALELRRALDELAAEDAPSFGDLRADTRHREHAPSGASLAPPARPLLMGVAVLAALDVAGGVVLLILGLLASLAGAGAGILAALLGALAIATGIGLWRMRDWAWILAMIVAGLGAVLGLVRAASGEPVALAGVGIQVVVVAYLFRVSRHFGSRAVAPG